MSLVLEALALSGFLNNSQNSIFFGLSKIYVSIVVRDVDDDIERVGHVSPLPGGGTARPSALAALRLMVSSNFVGCKIGRLLALEDAINVCRGAPVVVSGP
jgi:hypothetical protein